VILAPRSEVPDTYKSLISVIAPSRSRAPVIVKSSLAAVVPVTVLAKLTVDPCNVLLPSVTVASLAASSP
jgi:hypothetical protein